MLEAYTNMQTDTTAQRKRQRFGGGERGGLAGPLVDFATLGPATLRRRGPWSPCLNHASTSPPTISFTRHTAAASTSSIEYCTAGKGGGGVGGDCVTSERLRACNPARDSERARYAKIPVWCNIRPLSRASQSSATHQQTDLAGCQGGAVQVGGRPPPHFPGERCLGSRRLHRGHARHSFKYIVACGHKTGGTIGLVR